MLDHDRTAADEFQAVQVKGIAGLEALQVFPHNRSDELGQCFRQALGQCGRSGDCISARMPQACAP